MGSTMTIGVPKPQRKVDEKLLESVREQPCAVCGAAPPSDPSHIISRGAGGSDAPWNICPKCRFCHSNFHQMGISKFVRDHPRFRRWLEDHGWEIDSNGAPSIDLRGKKR